MKNRDQIIFALKRITTEQFAMIESALDESKGSIKLEANLRFGFDLDKRIISPIVAVNFSYDKNPFLLLEISCDFEIIEEHWDDLYNNETHELKLPMALARHFVILSIGTLRGVLHAKTENTPFNKYFLPTINVNDLVPDDVFINTDDKLISIKKKKEKRPMMPRKKE